MDRVASLTSGITKQPEGQPVPTAATETVVANVVATSVNPTNSEVSMMQNAIALPVNSWIAPAIRC